MNEKDIKRRLDFIEFRQDLLFENTAFSRLMYEHKITSHQHENILDLFASLRERIENEEKPSSSGYEMRIYEIVPQCNYNYHFAENVAKVLHEEGRYEEVFETLYGDSNKFQSYLERHRSN